MAENSIVQGLFGVDPTQYQQQQNQLANTNALQFAQLDPFQQANFGIYKGAGAIGQNLLGGQDPILQKATMAQQLATQFDLTNPQGLQQFAQALAQNGAPDLAQRAIARAQEMIKSGAESAYKMKQAQAEGTSTEWVGVPGQPEMKQQAIVNRLTGEITPIGSPISVFNQKTTNTINVEAAKNVLDIDKKDVENAVKVRDTAEQVIPRLQEQAAAIQRGIIGGSFADSRTAIATAFSSLGIKNSTLQAALSNSKSFKSNSTALASSVAKELGVNPTDRDFEAARDRFAKNSDSPEASAAFIADMLKIKERDYNNASGLIKHFRKTGGTLTGYDRPVPKSPLVTPLAEMSTEELIALQKQKSTGAK